MYTDMAVLYGKPRLHGVTMGRTERAMLVLIVRSPSKKHNNYDYHSDETFRTITSQIRTWW